MSFCTALFDGLHHVQCRSCLPPGCAGMLRGVVLRCCSWVAAMVFWPLAARSTALIR